MRDVAHRLRHHLREPQHRDATLLLANTGLQAAAGLAFWVVLTRLLDVPAATVGVGYAIVAVGTTIGLLAKGGLDTALVRMLPSADGRTGRRLLGLALAVAGGTAALVAIALRLAGTTGQLSPLTGAAWLGAAAIGLLLTATWLLDSYFLSVGEVRITLLRTTVASVLRITLPLFAIAWVGPGPVAVAWAAGLAVSVLMAVPFLLRRAARPAIGEAPNSDPVTSAAAAPSISPSGSPSASPSASARTPVGPFLATANRNLAGSAAEFLPGLLLAPLVLAVEGPAAAAYFGIAWTVASLLFLAAAAVGRSALAAMARPGSSTAMAVRRGALQAMVLVAGGAVVGIALGPFALGVFGADYAEAAVPAFTVLCLSALVVAPGSLYMSVLRMRESTATLILIPSATLVLLLSLVPRMEAQWGLVGVAGAWALANLPFGAWSVVRLLQEGKQPAAAPPPAAEAKGVTDA